MGKMGYFAGGVLALLLAATGAGAQVGVDGNTIKERQARPGETYSGVFAVKNSTAEPQEARIYQTDYFTNAEGTTIYGEPGSSPRSNARWIALGPARIVIPPYQIAQVPYTVRVPSGSPLSGTYWSLVMVEAVPRGSAESGLPTPPRGRAQGPAVGVSMRFRTAVQIVTDIDIAAKRDVKFGAPAVLVAKDSSQALQFDLQNTGNLAFGPVFTVEVYAADGSHVKTLTARRAIIYPGTSIRQQFVLGRLPAGKYRTIVTVDAGGTTVFGAQYAFRL
jgi:hypothetical protein